MPDRPNQPISGLFGHEPGREGEYPSAHRVGFPLIAGQPPVDLITYREDNFGDHGLGWFDVHAGGRIVASVAARAVAEIHYTEEQQA